MSSYEFKSNALCAPQYVSGLTYICIYIYMDSGNGDYDEVDGEKGLCSLLSGGEWFVYVPWTNSCRSFSRIHTLGIDLRFLKCIDYLLYLGFRVSSCSLAKGLHSWQIW